jgi:hypothetical protein
MKTAPPKNAVFGSRCPILGRTDGYPLRIFLKVRATECLQGELASPSSKYSKVKML